MRFVGTVSIARPGLTSLEMTLRRAVRRAVVYLAVRVGFSLQHSVHRLQKGKN